MGRNKEIKARLVIDAEVQAAEKAFDDLNAKVKDLWGGVSVPKSTLTSIEKLREKIVALRSASDSGELFNEEEIKQVKKECDAFKKTVYDLTLSFKLLSKEQKKALVGEDEAKKMEAREQAVDKYNKAVKKSIEAQKQKLDLEKKIAAAQKKQEKSAPQLSEKGQQVKRMNELAGEYGKKGTTKARKAELEKEFYSINLNAEDIKQGEEELKQWTQAMQEFNAENKRTGEYIESLKKKLQGLEVGDEKEAFKSLKEELKKLGVEGIDSAKDMEAVSNILNSLDERALAGVVSKIEDLSNIMGDLSTAAEGTGEKVKGAVDQIATGNKVAADQAAFEGKIKQFLGMAGAAEVLRRAVRNAFQTIQELDATMTEMAVVTDLTVGDYWDQLPEYSARARELGVSINSTYEAATLYYQQGLKSNEVTAISAETLKMARIAGLSAADATDKMTAALRGFNMELNETSAQRVADVYSQLAAITASDVNEISSAMTKTASIASSAGMEFETTAAFLAQIIETTRESAETAGTAMKTIVARFQELKKDPAEIGEVDGEIVNANQIEGALRSVGVSLRDANGQFRELDEVFLELASKWDSLDKNTQRYIATIAAGSRQQSRFIAMMSDYGRTSELVAAANNSAGASAQQFNKTLESLETKIANLKTAWQEFSMGIMNSDFVKFGVDVLTKFLNIVNEATNNLGGFWDSASKLAGVVTIFNLAKAAFGELKDSLKDFFVEVIEASAEAGEESGRAFAEGSKQGAQGEEENEEKESGGFKQGFKEWTGISSYQKALDTRNRTDQTENIEAKKVELQANKDKLAALQGQRDKLVLDARNAELEYTGSFARSGKGSKKAQKTAKENKANADAAVAANAKEIEEATRAVEENEQALTDLNGKQEAFKNKSKDAWAAVGEGIGQTSQALSAVGVGFSMVGGALEEMGLEGLGEAISGVGQAITIVGAALSVIPPILTLISTHPVVAIVIGALAIIMVAIIAITKHLKNLSVGAKLQEAQEAALAASEAADQAAESYNNLKDSIESLGDKYKDIEKLTRGTQEWRQAVLDINNTVLSLIDKYPELAMYVKNQEGVLSLDTSSQEVQNIMDKQMNNMILAKNQEIIANSAVQQAQLGVTFSEMDAVNEVAKKRGSENSSALWTIGTLTGNIPMLAAALIKGLDAKAKTKTDETLKEAVDGLAKSVSKGETNYDFDSMYNYLTESMHVAEEEAKILAEEFSQNTGALADYAATLNAAEAQQKAAYDAIAASAQQLANTMSFTAEEMIQSNVLVNGDFVKEVYEQEMSSLNDLKDRYFKNLNALERNDKETYDELVEAIQAQYGETARVDKRGNVTYKRDGGNETITLSPEQMKAMIANSRATEQTADAIENSAEAIDKLADTLGESIEKLYSQNEGGGLTQADVDNLKEKMGEGFAEKWYAMTDSEKEAKVKEGDIPQAIKNAWEALDPKLKKSYNNDITNLIDDMAEGIYIANDAFAKAGDRVEKFMTADMAKDFADKLNAIAELAGGEAAATAAEQATDAIVLAKDAAGNDVYTDDRKREIQERINITDWSSTEDLAKLEQDLIRLYGVNTNTAQEYIETLSAAAYATSNLNTTVLTMNGVWQATEKVAQSMEKLAALQWEYNRALEKGEGNIADLTDKMIEQYQYQAQQYTAGYEASNENIEKIYAQGFNKNGVNWNEYIKLGEYGVDYEASDIEGLRAIVGESGMADVQAYIDDLNKSYEDQRKQIKGLQESLDAIEELEQQGEDAYLELRDMVKDTLLSSMQKQIDLEQATLDATQEGNDKLLSKMQEQIDGQRQARELEKTEQNIADLEAQRAYLAAAGGSATELAALDQQIAEAKEGYQDSLVDQALANIQDANEKAAEQRQEQIDIAQQQLDLYSESAQFQKDVDDNVQTLVNAKDNWGATKIGEKMKEELGSMSETELANWQSKTQGLIDLTSNWQTRDWKGEKDAINGYLTTIQSALLTLPTNIQAAAEGRYTEEAITKLESRGFNREQLGTMSAKSLAEVETFAYRETGSSTDLSSKYSFARGRDSNVLSKEAYYSGILEQYKNSNGTFDIANARTYEEYLNQYINTDKAEEYRKWLVQSRLSELMRVYANNKTFDELTSLKGYTDALTVWKENYGTDSNFSAHVKSIYDSYRSPKPYLEDESVYVTSQNGLSYWGEDSNLILHLGENEKYYLKNPGYYGNAQADTTTSSYLNGLFSGTIADSQLVPYNNSLWVYNGSLSGWYKLEGQEGYNAYMKKLRGYKTGGLADFTGPAWLDGTKSKPEIVLNQKDSANFIQLRDILSEVMDSSKGSTTDQKSGNNYYEIEINVESLENDYDVEKLANKIRSMLYDDATRRNVNAVNQRR